MSVVVTGIQDYVIDCPTRIIRHCNEVYSLRAAKKGIPDRKENEMYTKFMFLLSSIQRLTHTCTQIQVGYSSHVAAILCSITDIPLGIRTTQLLLWQLGKII